MKMSFFIFMVVCSLFIATVSFGTNLIINGDFEAGNTGFSTGYQYYNGTDFQLTEGLYAIGSDPHNYHLAAASYGDHTSGNGNMMAANGAITSNVTLWEQTILVSPNTEYEFSAWLSNWSSVSYNLAQLEYSINDISIGSDYVPEQAGDWAKVSHLWQSGFNTTATIKIVDKDTSWSGNDFAIDDISFVPEPAMLLLFGLGGLMLRKRK